MIKHYRDYFWKDGLPYGLEEINAWPNAEQSYKIVMDPYRKRVSIEEYRLKQFLACIYDSALLNFRHLNQIEQQSWQKLPLQENSASAECIIRDQDDRVIFLETYTFEKNLCKTCMARSPQGILLTIQKMHYKILGDVENQVILYDAKEHPVLQKIYEADPVTGEFTNLIKEIRDMKEIHLAKNNI